ncbi:MAG: DNA polymerase I, partial [Deltaproteobacteria bacterium]|nr:DNA polymerase I [Deltaproteobacteria bacterium]
MIKSLDSFQEIWLADYEFQALLGGKPLPICMVAHELKKGHRIKVWQDRLLSLCTPPYSIGPNSLFIAYYSSAEFSCHFALDWELPQNVLDLYVEFRNLTNGCPIPSGSGLLGALIKYGIRKFDAIEKDEMRNLAIRGGPFTSDEQKSLLDYCESDVEALSLLFEKMEPELDLERALLRGESMKAVAAMEHTGVPIDMELFPRLKNNWASIKQKTVDQIDSQYGIYEGTSFKTKRFENYLQAENIPWPRLESGALELKESTFKHMSQTYPQLTALKDLRWTLSQMKLSELAVGPDGRNRCLLSPFRAKTGRNQPSTSKFIYGTAAWLRGLIKPEA